MPPAAPSPSTTTGAVEAEIRLDASRFQPDVIAGPAAFSHGEVVYVFDRVSEADINFGARHHRERADWPVVGIFARSARAPAPNRIGVSVCALLSVDGLVLRVRGLDAIDGTPVLDIKPYMTEFAPPRRHPRAGMGPRLMADSGRCARETAPNLRLPNSFSPPLLPLLLSYLGALKASATLRS